MLFFVNWIYYWLINIQDIIIQNEIDFFCTARLITKPFKLNKIIAVECGLYLDNHVFIFINKQTNTISTDQNRDEKSKLRNNKLFINY